MGDFDWFDYFSTDTVSGLVNSIGESFESVAGAASEFFNEFNIGDYVNKIGEITGTKNLFDDILGSGIDNDSLDVGSSMSRLSELQDAAKSATEPGLFDKTLQFIKQNPEATKLGAGLIGGALTSYNKQKELDQLADISKQKIEAEERMLRDKYKYDSASVAETRRQKAQDAFGVYMNKGA